MNSEKFGGSFLAATLAWTSQATQAAGMVITRTTVVVGMRTTLRFSCCAAPAKVDPMYLVHTIARIVKNASPGEMLLIVIVPETSIHGFVGMQLPADQVSESVENLKMDVTSIPLLPLMDGGKMPQAGLGLCCRKSAVGEAARQAVVDYLVMGGRLLDDAMVYNNHREVGQGVRDALTLGVAREDLLKIF
eukprot:70749-Amphidinium_carterae.1